MLVSCSNSSSSSSRIKLEILSAHRCVERRERTLPQSRTTLSICRGLALEFSVYSDGEVLVSISDYSYSDLTY